MNTKQPTTEKESPPAFVFEGFEPANTTPVPDVLFDELLTELSGPELKVILYIIRRTLGFKKSSDGISLSQFTDGITTRDGRVLDKGCGIKKRSTVSKILKNLIEKGCVEADKAQTELGDAAVTIYRIRFKRVVPNQPPGVGDKTAPPSPQTSPTVVPNQPLQGSPQSATRGSANLATHKKQYARNSMQETERQEGTYPAHAASDTSGFAAATPAHTLESTSSKPEPALEAGHPIATATEEPHAFAHSGQRGRDSGAGHTVDCDELDTLPGVSQQDDHLHAAASGRARAQPTPAERTTERDTRQPASIAGADYTKGRSDGLAAADAAGRADPGGDDRAVGAGGSERTEQQTLTAPEKPKAARGRKKPAEPLTFSERGQKIWDAWCANFKVAPPAGPQTILCADSLHDMIIPWCHERKKSCKELLNEIRLWLHKTDKSGFYQRGVTLCDVHRDFEKWQEAQSLPAPGQPARASEPTTLEVLKARKAACSQLGGIAI